MKNFAIEVLDFVVGTALNLLIGAFTSVILLSYWGWFIVPLGVRDINFFHAWGMLLIPTVLFLSTRAANTPEFVPQFDPDKALRFYGNLSVGGLFLWGFGYFLSVLMV